MYCVCHCEIHSSLHIVLNPEKKIFIITVSNLIQVLLKHFNYKKKNIYIYFRLANLLIIVR